MGIKMSVDYKCVESEGSTPVSSIENFFKLSCHIQKDTSFLLTGLKASLEEHISKFESTLGRDAVFEKKQSILRLPKFVTVQMVRFYWKAGVGKKPGNRAKVVKPIQFPEFLDLFDLCHDELKGKLKLKRDYLEKVEEKKLGLTKEEPVKPELPFSEYDNDTGKYQLSAIITHQGYSAQGGHYVAWVRSSHGDKKEWLLFDDDKVTRHNYDTVKALERSTGDGPIPYLLIYSTVSE
jgi:ubiquitin carboxyl-terminal hydrolase 14